MAAALLASPSCSKSTGTRASVAPSTTVVASTSSSSSSSTTVMVTTTATSRPTTTAPAASPEGYARALYDAWTKGDPAAAAKVAEPAAVSALFARTWQAGDGWSFSECSGAAGSLICTWRRSGGQELLFRVRNLTGGLPVAVVDVRFQP